MTRSIRATAEKPEAFDGRFRLAMTDIASFTLGSDIVQHLRKQAPSAAAEFIALDRSRLYDWFRNDMIDAAVVVYSADEGLYESELCSTTNCSSSPRRHIHCNASAPSHSRA